MELQVGVKVILKNFEGKILLIKRSEPLPDGSGIKWDVPGGRIKSGESLIDALARELVEETGIKLPKQLTLLNAQDIFIDEVNRHIVRLTYVAETNEKPNLSHEHHEYKWLSLTEALSSNIDPYLKEALNSLQHGSSV